MERNKRINLSTPKELIDNIEPGDIIKAIGDHYMLVSGIIKYMSQLKLIGIKLPSREKAEFTIYYDTVEDGGIYFEGWEIFK